MAEDNTTTQATAAKIKEIRQDLKLTQKELAAKAGINDNYYAKVERGLIKPSAEIYAKIAKALGAKSSDIFPF